MGCVKQSAFDRAPVLAGQEREIETLREIAERYPSIGCQDVAIQYYSRFNQRRATR